MIEKKKTIAYQACELVYVEKKSHLYKSKTKTTQNGSRKKNRKRATRNQDENH